MLVDTSCQPTLRTGKPVHVIILGPNVLGSFGWWRADYRFVFDAVRARPRFRELCEKDGPAVDKAGTFKLHDIDDLKLLPAGTGCVYSFCERAPPPIVMPGQAEFPTSVLVTVAGVGMPFETQEHILKLSTECDSVSALAV